MGRLPFLMDPFDLYAIYNFWIFVSHQASEFPVAVQSWIKPSWPVLCSALRHWTFASLWKTRHDSNAIS